MGKVMRVRRKRRLREEALKPFAFGAVAVTAIATLALVSHSVGDKTMTNCEVSFASNLFNTSAPSSVHTSCGYVYVNNHLKNGLVNPASVIAMNEAVHSGKPLTIKATGFAGVSLAYEITPSE